MRKSAIVLPVALLLASASFIAGCDDGGHEADASGQPDVGAADADAETAPDAATDGAAAAPDADMDADTAEVDATPITAESCDGDATVTAIFTVAPYVQNVLTDSAWILWETPEGEHGAVEWGPTEALGQTSCGGLRGFLLDVSLDRTELVHEAQLTGLEPDTTYWYRAVTGTSRSNIHHFRTTPTRDSEAPLRFVAMADSQRDDNNRTKFREVINDGVIPFVRAAFGEDLAKALGFFIVAGDLVDNGWLYEEWQTDFFSPAEKLMHEVPLYAVPGNHEGGSSFFWRYFKLPENGDAPYVPHWYYVDYSNVRLIGLDSNAGFQTQPQLDFLRLRC
ncbi:MAG: FN3 domain-containing metallophosphoesterase family protein [Myxococcota bacterium]